MTLYTLRIASKFYKSWVYLRRICKFLISIHVRIIQHVVNTMKHFFRWFVSEFWRSFSGNISLIPKLCSFRRSLWGWDVTSSRSMTADLYQSRSERRSRGENMQSFFAYSFLLAHWIGSRNWTVRCFLRPWPDIAKHFGPVILTLRMMIRISLESIFESGAS